MTAFSLRTRLHHSVNSRLALSLPQSFVAAKRRQKPAPSSEGAEAAPAADHRFSFAVKVRRKRYTLSGDTTPQSRLRRASSPYTGEPRTALSCRSENLTQGSREKFCARRGSALAKPIAAQPPCGVCSLCRVIKIITSAGAKHLRGRASEAY